MQQKKTNEPEYINSVNFLAKIIRQMEDSAKSYDKLAYKLENDYQAEDQALNILEELMNRMKLQFGYKYKNRVLQVMSKMEEKAQAIVHRVVWHNKIRFFPYRP